MAWTAEDRRRYAPALQETLRQGMLVRLATTIDAIHPASSVGRPRLWPTLTILQALWHLTRDDRAWRRLPPNAPPHQTVWSRLMSWQRHDVLDRALDVLVGCRRLVTGRKPAAERHDHRHPECAHPARNVAHEGTTPTRR